MVEITLKSAPTGSRKAVSGFGQTPIKHFRAVNVSGFLELAGVHGEISVGRSEQSFQFIKGERNIGGQGADNPQPHALVDQPVKPGRHRPWPLTMQGSEPRLLRAGSGNAFCDRRSELRSQVAS